MAAFYFLVSLFIIFKNFGQLPDVFTRIFEEAFGIRQVVAGGLATYTFVWDLGDIGIALMTIFNMIAILPMSGQAVKSLEDYIKNH